MGKFSNKSKGGPSKRRTLKDKYKIEKKVRAHKKKTRRVARKLQLNKRKRTPKQQPLPNLYPFKAQIIEAAKREKQIEKQTVQNKKMLLQVQNNQINPPQIFISKEEFIKKSDVVVIVVDARNPEICRSQSFQNEIKQYEDKKIVFLLNKIDLVPIDQAEKWQVYLNNYNLTILFRSTSNQREKFIETQSISTKKKIGISGLIHGIKKIVNNQAVTIGIAGVHRTGKKSVIELLKNAMPNINQQGDIIKIDRQINLLKYPYQYVGNDQQNIIFKNPESNPRQFINLILQTVSREDLTTLYQIQDYTNTADFLSKVAKSLRKLAKGGVPDLIKAEKAVIADWNNGKIVYYKNKF